VQAFDGIAYQTERNILLEHFLESRLAAIKQDLVFILKIEVERRRAILNAFSNLPNGHFTEALLYE
jgi:hypothetical protein